MLSLCHFVDKHTVEALNEPTAERVATLIEVNRQIANGLLASLQSATQNPEIEEENPQNTARDLSADTIISIDRDV